MSVDDGLPDEMGRLPMPGRRRGTPPALDDDTLTRLLDGRLAPADAPPGYAGVAAVLAELTAPPRAVELAGGTAAAAGFAAGLSAPAPPRREAMPRKLPVRMLALVATGVLFGGAAAALSTGATSEDEPTDSPTITVTEAPEPDTEASANSSAEGPNVTGAPKFGLCAAYFAGQGRENGNKSESSAFQALTAAAESSPGATDEERVATFCADVLDDDSPGNSGDHRADGDDNSSNGANNGAGSGANNGAGNAGGGNEIADDASNGKAGGKASEHQP